MNDVNGKQFSAGSEVYVPCKVLSAVQQENRYVLELELKYHNRPYHTVLVLKDVVADQVIKSE